MGKRSNFERVPRDFYPTPEAAVKPLLAFLTPATQFIEPCVGRSDLAGHLQNAGHNCLFGSDIVNGPDVDDLLDARIATYPSLPATHFITNPPWDRDVLHPIIGNLTRQLPTWLLLDADWMHTKQAIPYMAQCDRIVSVGRVKWIPGSKSGGKDNCCWYRFQRGVGMQYRTDFYGRAA